MPVSIFAGEVCRSWRFADRDGVKHEVSLYHHPLTGARAAMVDHEELEGSLGTTSLLHGARTAMPFQAGSARGTVNIVRDRMVGFEYSCIVDGVAVAEATTLGGVGSRQFAPGTSGHARFESNSEEGQPYVARVSRYATTRDHEQPTTPITWYEVRTLDSKTGAELTCVHRRFRDFSDLDETVQAAFQGHHMLASVPPLPSKRFKLVQDHLDTAFLEQRQLALQAYVSRLCAVPHVWSTPGMKPFFGLADGAREYSIIYPGRTLGFTVGKCGPKKSPEAGDTAYEPPDFPAFVASVQPPSQLGQIAPKVGDLVSKISGRATCALRFKAVIVAIKDSPRPIIIHFIGGQAPRPDPPAAAPRSVPVVTAAPPPRPHADGQTATVPNLFGDPFGEPPLAPPPQNETLPQTQYPPAHRDPFARLPDTPPPAMRAQPSAHGSAHRAKPYPAHSPNIPPQPPVAHDASAYAALHHRDIARLPPHRDHQADENPFSTPDHLGSVTL